MCGCEVHEGPCACGCPSFRPAVDLVLGPKSQAVMNGPQYTQRAKAREPSEVDLPAPHQDG